MTVQRIEADLIQLLSIPPDVLYGVHTRSAELNFNVSGMQLKDLTSALMFVFRHDRMRGAMYFTPCGNYPRRSRAMP